MVNGEDCFCSSDKISLSVVIRTALTGLNLFQCTTAVLENHVKENMFDHLSWFESRSIFASLIFFFDNFYFDVSWKNKKFPLFVLKVVVRQRLCVPPGTL